MTQNSGAAQVEQVFNRLSTVMQTKLVGIAAKSVVLANQQRIARQVDVNGVAFKARKDGTNKPMFATLGQRLQVLSFDADGAVIGFAGNGGMIAEKHQYGVIETITATKNSRVLNAPATLKQAIELVRLGLKVGKTKPTTGYITSMACASVIVAFASIMPSA